MRWSAACFLCRLRRIVDGRFSGESSLCRFIPLASTWGKTTFHLVALGAAGKVLVKRKFTQKQLLTYMDNLQMSLLGLEACAGAHFLGRALRKQGHDVKLIPGQFVKPASAIASASTKSFLFDFTNVISRTVVKRPLSVPGCRHAVVTVLSSLLPYADFGGELESSSWPGKVGALQRFQAEGELFRTF